MNASCEPYPASGEVKDIGCAQGQFFRGFAESAAAQVPNHRLTRSQTEGTGEMESPNAHNPGNVIQIQVLSEVGFDIPECFGHRGHRAIVELKSNIREVLIGVFDRSCCFESGTGAAVAQQPGYAIARGVLAKETWPGRARHFAYPVQPSAAKEPGAEPECVESPRLLWWRKRGSNPHEE